MLNPNLEMMIKKEISDKVLLTGPDYQNHRGGIGAVLATYKSFFETFHFIPSYRPFDSNLKKISFFNKQMFAIGKALRKNKQYEIVHIHGSHSGSFYRKLVVFYVAKKIHHRKVIYHLHSSDYDQFYSRSNGFSKKLIRYLIREADLVICLSPSWEKYYREQFSPKQIVIVNNPVDDTIEKATLDASGAIRFLFLGRIGVRKGIFDILEVLAKHKDRFAGRIHLSVGGDGEVDKFKQLVTQHGLEDMVEYVGWVDAGHKKELLLNSHVYILPSYSEGLPISVLEAMSYGLPILSTPVGGIPEVVRNEVNGLLVEPGNLDQLAAAMLDLIDNPGKLKQYGTASLSEVKPYLPASVAGQLEGVYKSLLGTL